MKYTATYVLCVAVNLVLAWNFWPMPAAAISLAGAAICAAIGLYATVRFR